MELFKLWDSDGNTVAENATEEYCWKLIKDHAESKNLGLYYRMHQTSLGEIYIDYGSHFHFFYMKSERANDDLLVKEID